MEVVLETKNLCKSFGAVMVNDKINLTLHRGEIMAVLGERFWKDNAYKYDWRNILS